MTLGGGEWRVWPTSLGNHQTHVTRGLRKLIHLLRDIDFLQGYREVSLAFYIKYLESLLLPQVFEIRKFLEDERISNRKEREGHGELRYFFKEFRG